MSKLTISSQREDLDNNVYFNVSVINNDEDPVPLKFSQTLTSNLVDRGRDWFFSIVRWNLDGTTLPWMFFPDNQLYVALKYGNPANPDDPLYNASQVVINTVSVVPPFPSGVVYSNQFFAGLVNTALATCFATLAGTVPGGLPPGATAPYMLWNSNTQRFSMYFDANWLQSVPIANQLQCFFNRDLFVFFGNFEVIGFLVNPVTHKDFQISVYDMHGANSAPLDPTVPAGKYVMTAEYPAPGKLANAVSRIGFVSNLLGTRPEFTQTSDQSVTALTASGTAGSGIPSSSYVTDFIPNSDVQDAAGYRQDLLYLPQPQYRLVDILSNDSIRQIDLAVYYYDQQGRQYPFYIQKGKAATFKFAFFKKDLYKNYAATSMVGVTK